MKNTTILILIFYFTLSGCATIFKKTNDEIKFTSNIPNIKVFIDGQFLGETPLSVTLTRSLISGQKNIARFVKEGYQTQEFKMKKEFETIAILNTTSITSWAVDALTGAMIKYSPTEYHVQMLEDGKQADSHEFQRKKRIYQFALLNYVNIKIDIIKGGGEYLSALTSMYVSSEMTKGRILIRKALKCSDYLVETNSAYGLVLKYNELYKEPAKSIRCVI